MFGVCCLLWLDSAVYAPDKSVLGSVCYDKNDMLTQFRDGAQPRRMAVLVPNDVLKTSMTPEVPKKTTRQPMTYKKRSTKDFLRRLSV
jgi:hypothetical protein